MSNLNKIRELLKDEQIYWADNHHVRGAYDAREVINAIEYLVRDIRTSIMKRANTEVEIEAREYDTPYYRSKRMKGETHRIALTPARGRVDYVAQYVDDTTGKWVTLDKFDSRDEARAALMAGDFWECRIIKGRNVIAEWVNE